MTSDEQRAASEPGPHPTNGVTDPARIDLLDRYWDAVTGNGYQRAEAVAIDPARARTVDQVQTLAHDQFTRIPDGARARIWRETAAEAGIPTRQEPPVASSSSPAGGLAAPSLTLPASSAPHGRPPAYPGGRLTMPGGRGPSQPTGHGLWPRLQFAIAAVLILGLFATILAPMDDERIGLFGGTDSTPTTTVSGKTPPSIGYPEAFTGGGRLIDLPVSATGHTVSLDRVVLAKGATLTLPPGSARTVSSVTGSFTADRGSGSLPLTVDQPGQIDIGLAGGSVSADQGEDVTVTVLTIAPEGMATLASSDDVTVYPLTSYTSGGFRFESQQNVLFGTGPVPADPTPVPPSSNTDDPQNFANPGTLMLLYAEQGSISIAAPGPLVRRADTPEDDPAAFATTLTIAQGEAAIVSNPSLATIQQAIPGQGAVYTVAFLSPPALDRTPGRTYPNTAGYGYSQNQGPFTVPADGNDYQIVLDRLTLDPGAIAAFAPGAFRAVQWTGGGDVVMTVQGGGQSPLTIPNPTLNGSFQDQGFSLVVNGDAPVTLTLLSYLPVGAPDETVAAGQDGVTSERLIAYEASNPSNALQLQVSFSVTAAQAFPVELYPWFDLNAGRNVDDSYALIRLEDGPITLNRPATRIVDGQGTAEIAAGEPVPPGATVVVRDLRDATISGPTDGTSAGYTIVIVSPYADPYGTGAGSATPALTGLTPASLDTVADVPVDQPLDVTLVRHTLGPGAMVTVSPAMPPTARAGDVIDPFTVLNYVAQGNGTILSPGGAPAEIASRSSELAMSAITTGGLLTVTAGPDGLTVYQLVIGTGRPGIGRSGDAESLDLGRYVTEAPLGAAGAPDGTVRVRTMLRATTGLGPDASQNLGDDATITLLTPLAGDALIVPGVGDVRVVDPADADRNGAAITTPWRVAPDSGVIAAPGGQFRVSPIGDSLSYLWAEIEIFAGDSAAATPATLAETPSAAIPTAATPIAGVPVGAAVPACDITPRTVDDLLTLYDAGVANPVDPYTLGHRDDLGTGTPADDATIAAVTDTLLRLSACQTANDPLRRYALYSDAYLQAVLPITYDNRDDLASLLAQPPAQASETAIAELSISDVELFADGRVGARVALATEFAYITFSRAPDGTWSIDLWDDRDEPGA